MRDPMIKPYHPTLVKALDALLNTKPLPPELLKLVNVITITCRVLRNTPLLETADVDIVVRDVIYRYLSLVDAARAIQPPPIPDTIDPFTVLPARDIDRFFQQCDDALRELYQAQMRATEEQCEREDGYKTHFIDKDGEFVVTTGRPAVGWVYDDDERDEQVERGIKRRIP
jgi:hypothetical protein